MMENLPDDGSPESKEEEVVRREACANGFIGKSSCSSVNLNSDDYLQGALTRSD